MNEASNEEIVYPDEAKAQESAGAALYYRKHRELLLEEIEECTSDLARYDGRISEADEELSRLDAEENIDEIDKDRIRNNYEEIRNDAMSRKQEIKANIDAKKKLLEGLGEIVLQTVPSEEESDTAVKH